MLELALELYAEADTDLQNAVKELISLTSESSSSENEDADANDKSRHELKNQWS